jgi:hypothetical protein
MIEFILFGLYLNVFSFLVHTFLTFVSAYNLGFVKSVEISNISLKILQDYKNIKLKYEPIRFYLYNLSIFIPFYATWTWVNVMSHYKETIPYLELPIILKMLEIDKLKQKYRVK